MSTEVTTEIMNEVIARFIGMELKQDKDDPEWINGPNKSFWPSKTPPPFNTSWDWLMPVVEKISKIPLLNHDNTPCSDPRDVCHPITFAMPTEDGKQLMFRFKGFGLCIADTLIDAVHEACYEVAEYHNNKNKPMAVRQSLKDFIREYGPFYAPIAINPLDYHGYKYTKENADEIVEAIHYEISLYPEHADVLLDHINNVKAKIPTNDTTGTHKG